jgi:DDE family transposase/transposase-like protein DUF772
VTLGRADRQGELFDDAGRFCEASLPENSIFRFLARERDRLFPDELFADLFTERGRRSVPPSVVATVMVLQRLEGLSDREAVDRYAFDARWRYAAGVGGYRGGGWERFAHTVLVDMRERLRRSDRPNRIFEVGLEAARVAGLIGRRRVLDSTPLYDAVATMDTVTLIRSALRGLLAVADADLRAELRAVLASGDDYVGSGKPQIDWDDPAACEELIDSRARDGFAVLALLHDRELVEPVVQAAALLASVLGQDLQTSADGVFRVARRVAADRVISTVDPDARHGRKSAAHGFDGYQGHVAVDPDSEIITATTVTPGNGGDAGVAADLIADLHPEAPADEAPADRGDPIDGDEVAESSGPEHAGRPGPAGDPGVGSGSSAATVYGDNAYGTGPFHEHLAGWGIDSRCKTQAPNAPGGRFSKDRFDIDLQAGTATCPAGVAVAFRATGHQRHAAVAEFGTACADCPLRAHCTTAATGRTITIGPHEAALAAARARQLDPDWINDYRTTRPKVERKIGHLMRRHHGGRRVRVRGTHKVDADFRLLAAGVNLARLAALGVRGTITGWATA